MSDADTPLSIDTFDAATRARLQQLAQSRSQLVTDVVRKAVKHYLTWLDGLPTAERSAVEAVAEYDANGLHLTAAEADMWLAELEAGHDVDPPACHT
jgi:predicted transcriptional regulator